MKVNFLADNENLLQADVLCLKNCFDYILAGIGNKLYIYKDHILLLSQKIFVNERIHNIYCFNDTIFLKGIKQLTQVKLINKSDELICKFLCELQFKNWIQDLTFLNEYSIGLVTAHNFFECWDLKLSDCVKTYSTEEKCILYSCKILGNILENLIIFSGTVFGDILIWTPDSNECLLSRFKAHDGAVFSIEVNSKEKILSTTSDDRSLRIWHCNSEEEILSPTSLKNCNINLLHTLYGHTARVWRSLLISNYYVTIGEDSQIIIWRQNGTMLKNFTWHQECGIRGICYSEETQTLITGGEDGGINVVSWKFLVAETEQILNKKNFNFCKNFSAKVYFLKNGYLYTKSGGCVFMTEPEQEIIYENENFINYCVIEISPLQDYVALGSLRGHLIIIESATKEVLIEGEYINGRIFSIHWLNDYILICGPNGQLSLWQFSTNILNCVKTFLLPDSKERWTTCSLMKGDSIIIGDRMGNIYLFDLKRGEQPIKSFVKIHSYLGVTDMMYDKDTLFTIGRDGTLKSFINDLNFSNTYKLPFEWPWKIVKHNNDIYILGFHGVIFVVWSLLYREVIASHSCGGGHRSCDYKLDKNKLFFLYVREKKMYEINFTLDAITRLKKGFHGKEINCLKIISKNFSLIITGSEDTTLRISRLIKSEIDSIYVFKTHLSSIRSLSFCLMSNEKYLIVSVGGKAQIVLWCFNTKNLKCKELINYRLKKEVQNWKNSTPVNDPEAQFMCVDILKLQNGYFIATGCSDCQLRLFMYNENFSLLASISYTHCILNIAILKVGPMLLVVSMGTDGYVVFWDISNDYNPIQLEKFCIHQSGINSFYFEKLGPEKFLLVTGGDDNMLSVSYVTFSEKKIMLNKLWKNSQTHSCQITGIQIRNNVLLTTSVDQRITLWNWSFTENKFVIEYVDQRMTAIPDVKGMEVDWCSDTEILVTVFGKGIETFKVHSDYRVTKK